MRSKIIYLLALILVGAIACQKCEEKVEAAAEKKNEVEGVWEKFSGKLVSPDTIIETIQADRNRKSIKVITKSYFVTVGHTLNRPKFSEGGTDSELLAAYNAFSANGGKYTLEGDTYTEHLEFFLNPTFENVSVSFKYQVNGDQLIISGTMPTKSLGLADFDWELTEVWRKIE